MTVTNLQNSSIGSKLKRALTLPRKFKYERKKKKDDMQGVRTLGDDLGVLQQDRVIKSDPSDNRWRRTLQLRRDPSASWGFTLQSYGIRHKHSNELELMTYVDYVEIGGPAYVAGLRQGDVILSIDGVSMEEADHPTMVHYIKAAGTTMRLVVLFEDCCRKVELHLRSIRLQQIYNEKVFELRALEMQERKILNGESTLDPRRLSLASSLSSYNSDLDERLSLRPELDVCPSPRSPFTPGPSSNAAAFLNLEAQSLSGAEASASSPQTNGYNFYSLPTKGRRKAQERAANTFGAQGAVAESVTSLNEEESSDASSVLSFSPSGSTKGMKRRQLNASVSGDVSYVRDSVPMKSSKSVASFRSESEYELPRRAVRSRISSRAWSFRRQLHDQKLKAKRLSRDSGEFVVTEESGKAPSDPELLNLRKLVSDFRMDYVHNSLTARRQSQDVVSSPPSRSSSADYDTKGYTVNVSNGVPKYPTMPRELSADSLLRPANFYIGEEDSSPSCDKSPVTMRSQSLLRWKKKGHIGEWLEMGSLSNKFAQSNLSTQSPVLSLSDGAVTPCSDLSRCSWDSEVFDSSTPTPKLSEKGSDSPVPHIVYNATQEACTVNQTPRQLEHINENEEITKL